MNDLTMDSTLKQRYSTFENMPNKDEKYIFELARCGFAYSPAKGERPSMVKCEFCKLVLENVQATTDCWMEHLREPRCIYLLEKVGVANIQAHRFLPIYNVNTRKIRQLKENWIEHVKDQLNVGEGRQVGTYTSSIGVKFSEPHNTAMAKLSVRRASLDNIPVANRRMQNLNHVAEAGLYFDGSHIRCYYCAIIIPNCCTIRDPWLAHASVTKNCFHNIMMFGDDFALIDALDSDGNYLSNLQRNGRINRCCKCTRNLDPSQMVINLCCRIRICYECATMEPCPNCNSRQGINTCFTCGRNRDQSQFVRNLCCYICTCIECTTGEQEPCPNCNYRPGN